MKKIALFTLVASIFMLTACQDPIYEAIRQDVKPEEPTVSGNIGNITRYTASGEEFLVLAADDGLRYKQKDNASHGGWKTYQLPFELHRYDFDSSSHTGEQLISVFADSTTLYLISSIYGQTNTEGVTYPYNIILRGKVITANGSDWNEEGEWKIITQLDSTLFPVYTDSSDNYITKFRVFQTNAPKAAHRKVYIRAYNGTTGEEDYYEMSGLDDPKNHPVTPSRIIDPEPSSDAGYKAKALGAVYFNDEVKFFTSPAVATNETYTSDATYYYFTNGNNKLYYSNGSTTTTFGQDFASTISALPACSDALIVGYGNNTSNNGGIEKASLINGVPTAIQDFATNAKYQITSSYMVITLLNATPEKEEIDSNLYASLTFTGTSNNFDNIGLWSYYPNRGNWNRE